ncbi:flagellar associated protein, partial [Haematococcus lacustris]
MANSEQAVDLSSPHFKMPGYTGYKASVGETYRKGPVMSQLEVLQPGPDSFIFTRTIAPPRPYATADIVARPQRQPDNLWPNQQTTARLESAKPAASCPRLGDLRTDVFLTGNQVDYKVRTQTQAEACQCTPHRKTHNSRSNLRYQPPATATTSAAWQQAELLGSQEELSVATCCAQVRGMFLRGMRWLAQLRSPNRNEDLAQTTASMTEIYASAYNRVGEARLRKIIQTMRERLTAKMGNNNDNAFRFRRLFQAFDTAKTGKVHFEDFRNMSEQFGMQLDDDSLLAMLHVYDPEGTGFLEYHDLVCHLMDPDCWALYVNDIDVSAVRAEQDAVVRQLQQLQTKFASAADALGQVLQVSAQAASQQ